MRFEEERDGSALLRAMAEDEGVRERLGDMGLDDECLGGLGEELVDKCGGILMGCQRCLGKITTIDQKREMIGLSRRDSEALDSRLVEEEGSQIQWDIVSLDMGSTRGMSGEVARYCCLTRCSGVEYDHWRVTRY